MEKIRKHFYFSGRVQGVGFCYRSYYIAQSMGHDRLGKKSLG